MKGLLQICPARFIYFRPTLKIKGRLLKKQANELSVEQNFTNMFNIVSVAMLLNQQERPPIKYCYPSRRLKSTANS